MSDELPEAWLRGPIEGVDPVLQPAAHALQQSREEIEHAASDLSHEELWARPGNVAAVGFHLRHLAASTDRLMTYAAGNQLLSPEQKRTLAAEKEPLPPDVTAASLVLDAQIAFDRALAMIRAADPATLQDARAVGRAALPSTVLGILFHIAEHAQRHSGQIVTTTKIVRQR